MSGWQSIETAPKDGRPILLLSAPQTIDMGPNGIWHHPPRIALGKWWADGDSWVDEYGRQGEGREAFTLGVTGVWESGGGWFQPDEVTHWHPLPDVPALPTQVTTPQLFERDPELVTNREYRHAYAGDFVFSILATQLKVLREERGWTQAQLAKHVGTSQTGISRLEDVNYTGWSVRSLLKLACAFDVYLRVRFEPFTVLLDDMNRGGRAELQCPPFPEHAYAERGTSANTQISPQSFGPFYDCDGCGTTFLQHHSEHRYCHRLCFPVSEQRKERDRSG